jgi:hypothetical protein
MYLGGFNVSWVINNTDMSSETKLRLPIHNLAERHYGLTPPVANSYTEAARVCLDRHHVPPIDFIVTDDGVDLDATAEWEPTDDHQRTAWANENDATRDGAYACVLAAVELTKGMVAMRRAEIKTGADYYVGRPGEALEDLEKCYRLEISGVDKGTPSTVQQRVREKLGQTAAGASNLPAIAGVVGFRAKLVILQRLEE